MAFNGYLVDNKVVLVQSCALRDPLTGVETLTTPTAATFTRVQEGGSTTTYHWPGDAETDNPAEGYVTCEVIADVPGREKWRCVTTGACECASERQFQVYPSSVAA